ncbi:MAG TPA: fumarylacetoacetate hydrolase family protein [Steroidobacteraceae bacterium]|jgi:2-keto-4-pentenoate hydratase/2-oxohepta-3-ene-1,7-dioic acid hydratase in catechol pathway|nr:fumarylacetoacetate hydrolase family protein [Steroidobacteraceae bacterium]
MHLASFHYDNRDRIGWRTPSGQLLCLHDCVAALPDPRWRSLADCRDMLALLNAGSGVWPQLAALASAAAAANARVMPIALSAVRWLPPVTRPGKILGVAMNNRASDARKISAPNHPMFFLKAPTCLIGHGAEIVVRPYYGGLHPEPELAVVIGSHARDLDPATALEVVCGYTIMNDITGNAMRAEDRVHYYALYASAQDPQQLERREQHLSYAARYKGTDGFGPCGPWLVTRDEIANPDALDVVCKVGGETIAEDSTAYYSYTVAEILAFISRYQTLLPGDIISMGTAFRPSAGSNRSLHLADLQRLDGPVEVTITGLGTLSNGVRREAPDLPDWRLAKPAA